MQKILFICKRRLSYGISYGLINSARFVAEALKLLDIRAKVIDVIDNNQIDREVHSFKPTHVVIEALWVVPEKFPILLKLHPNVQWMVRIHSKPTFIANEGIAMQWLSEYAKIAQRYCNFHISANDKEFADYLGRTFDTAVIYTPNIYHPVHRHRFYRGGEGLHIGCFGAVRPMKNHLIQAFAAIEFAKDQNKRLYFHINSDRLEQNGDRVISNLRALFDSVEDAILVEHPWMSHNRFIQLVSRMDLGMQVSLSETFNIVTADFVSLGIPVVVCPDIWWAPYVTKADPTSISEIVRALHRVQGLRWLVKKWARFNLKCHNLHALSAWQFYLRNY